MHSGVPNSLSVFCLGVPISLRYLARGCHNRRCQIPHDTGQNFEVAFLTQGSCWNVTSVIANNCPISHLWVTVYIFIPSNGTCS